MKENVREEERDTTTHLIKIPVFTHASHVTKFSVYILRPRQGQITRLSMDLRLYRSLPRVHRTDLKLFVVQQDRL